MTAYTGPSPRQFDVLRFIASHIDEQGYRPTLRELCAGTGITSTNAANQHVQALVHKGLIVRRPMLTRAIVITAAGREFLQSAAQPTAVVCAEGES